MNLLTPTFHEYVCVIASMQFVGDWEVMNKYPLRVGEAQGGIIGKDLVVTGGFLSGWNVTAATYALDVTIDSAKWRRMDDFPLQEGMTHAAFAIHKDRMYFCGGYLGKHPGQAVADCFTYDHSIPPRTSGQWSRLPSLPQPRAGGGMVYNELYQVLVFAGGAMRPIVGKADAVDYNDVWMLPPNSIEYGWVAQTTIPHFGNHLSYATTSSDGGKTIRHFMMGGQEDENEWTGNLDVLVEYLPLSNQWISRAPMLEPRGHASSSTIPYGCGFLIAGGAVQGSARLKAQTSDVSYYDPILDQWTSIGSLVTQLKTPVCGIYGDYLYCSTGYTVDTHRRKLRISN